MPALAFILNLPWTILALVAGLLCLPRRISFHYHPLAILISVKSFWLLLLLPGKKGLRATTLGNVVLLGQTLENDLEHELVHVRQYQYEPFIHPFLYMYQTLKHGYRQNPYEREAYTKAGNPYIEK